MDIATVITAVVIFGSGVGSWFQGRKTGISGALQTASDVVGMLAAQVGELRAQLAVKDAQIEQLRTKLASLEGHSEDDERA